MNAPEDVTRTCATGNRTTDNATPCWDFRVVLPCATGTIQVVVITTCFNLRGFPDAFAYMGVIGNGHCVTRRTSLQALIRPSRIASPRKDPARGDTGHDQSDGLRPFVGSAHKPGETPRAGRQFSPFVRKTA